MSLLDRPTLDDHERWEDSDPWKPQPATEETSEQISDAGAVAPADAQTDETVVQATGLGSAATRSFLQTLLLADDVVIDINENRVDLADRPTLVVAAPSPAPTLDPAPVTQPEPDLPPTEPRPAPATKPARAEQRRRQVRGLQLRRVRLRSVLKVGIVFFAVAYAALVGASVLLWNGAQRLGVIGSAEGAITNALGSDSFAISGQTLFDMVTIGAGVVCVLGLVITLLLAVVYNVTGMLFGGLAFETAPLRSTRSSS